MPNIHSIKSLILLISLTLISNANADTLAKLDKVQDLAILGQQIKSDRKPLLLLFSAEHCEYCERLTAEQLSPMASDNTYKNQLIFRELKIDDAGYFNNFNGQQISYEEFADLYAIDVTPTLVLLDHKGRMLTRRIVGYGNPDFFSAYMDEHIQVAVKKLQQVLN